MTREEFLLNVVIRIDNELDSYIRRAFDSIRYDSQYPSDTDFNQLSTALRIYKTVKKVAADYTPAPSDVASLIYDASTLFKSVEDITVEN